MLAVILVLQYAEPVLIPIVIGVLISYVLGPLVDVDGETRRAAGLARAASVIGLCARSRLRRLQADRRRSMSIVDELPDATRRLARTRSGHRDGPKKGAFEKMQRAAKEIDKAAAAAAEPAPAPTGVSACRSSSRRSARPTISGPAAATCIAFLGQSAMVLFLVFFLLVTGDLFKRKLVKIAGPTLTKKKMTVQIMDDINQQISSFLRVQVHHQRAGRRSLTALALWFFGVRQFVIWGMLAGIFNSIPYLGPLVVTAGLGVVTFMQFDDLLRRPPTSAPPRSSSPASRAGC